MGDGADDAERRAEVESAEPTEAEREELENSPPELEPEVRSEEFTRGIEQPKWESPLPDEAVQELRLPLDPNRIRTRQGRGSGKFEYLAGHDVKRRANEIFGFGNWGYTVESLDEIAAIEVENSEGRKGWHVGYRAVVRVDIRDCPSHSDVGYGDGVEYTPAARISACELATKEAVTDALKRALTGWGDQFGLILYAKADEKQRINREANRQSTGGEVRQDHQPAVPRTWAEINSWIEPYGPELGWREWMMDAAFLLFDVTDFDELTTAQKTTLGQKASGAAVKLRELVDPRAFPPFTRKNVQDAWAAVLGGDVLEGPQWRLTDEETYLITYAEHTVDDAVVDRSDSVAEGASAAAEQDSAA